MLSTTTKSLKSALLTALLILTSCTTNTPQLNSEGYRPLFNGKNLNNWVDINGHENTWTVQDNMIKCTGKPICMLRTKKMYENFILELQWQHLQKISNAGVFVWTGATTAPGQPFLKGIEVQIMAGYDASWYTSDGDIFPTHGADMIPANPRWWKRSFPTEKRINPVPQWNHFKIICIDGTVSLHVNGKLVNQGFAANPRKGYIALESEGGPINFKDIVIKELPPSKTPLKKSEIAKADTGFKNLYTSPQLDQWQVTPNQKNWVANDWTLNHDGKGKTLWHKNKFQNFTLITDYKFQGKKEDLQKTNPLLGAIMLRSTRQSSQIQLNSKGSSGAVRLSTQRNTAPAKINADNPAPSWNRLEITRNENQLIIKVNDKIVNQINNLQSFDPIQLGLLSTSKMTFANILIKEN